MLLTKTDGWGWRTRNGLKTFLTDFVIPKIAESCLSRSTLDRRRWTSGPPAAAMTPIKEASVRKLSDSLFTGTSIRQSEFLSVTRLGDFSQFLSTNLLIKLAQKYWWLFGLFRNGSLYVRAAFLLFGQLLETFGLPLNSNFWSHWFLLIPRRWISGCKCY